MSSPFPSLPTRDDLAPGYEADREREPIARAEAKARPARDSARIDETT